MPTSTRRNGPIPCCLYKCQVYTQNMTCTIFSVIFNSYSFSIFRSTIISKKIKYVLLFVILTFYISFRRSVKRKRNKMYKLHLTEKLDLLCYVNNFLSLCMIRELLIFNNIKMYIFTSYSIAAKYLLLKYVIRSINCNRCI